VVALAPFLDFLPPLCAYSALDFPCFLPVSEVLTRVESRSPSFGPVFLSLTLGVGVGLGSVCSALCSPEIPAKHKVAIPKIAGSKHCLNFMARFSFLGEEMTFAASSWRRQDLFGIFTVFLAFV
jgi:hypothetical protein